RRREFHAIPVRCSSLTCGDSTYAAELSQITRNPSRTDAARRTGGSRTDRLRSVPRYLDAVVSCEAHGAPGWDEQRASVAAPSAPAPLLHSWKATAPSALATSMRPTATIFHQQPGGGGALRPARPRRRRRARPDMGGASIERQD